MPISPHLATVRAKVGHDLLATSSAAIAVFDDLGRLLLVKLADTGTWSFPGGAIDPDELPADAAVRECYEETGLLVKLNGLIGVFGGPEFRVTYPNGDVTYYTTIAFQAQQIGGTCRADGIETLGVQYFTQQECSQLLLTPPSRVIIATVFDPNNAPFFAAPTWSPLETH